MTDLDNVDRMRFVMMREHPLMGYALFFMIGAYLALVLSVPVILCIIALVVLIICTVVFVIKQKKSWCFIVFVFIIAGYVLCNSSIPKWYREDYVPPEKCQITGTVESVKIQDIQVNIF